MSPSQGIQLKPFLVDGKWHSYSQPFFYKAILLLNHQWQPQGFLVLSAPEECVNTVKSYSQWATEQDEGPLLLFCSQGWLCLFSEGCTVERIIAPRHCPKSECSHSPKVQMGFPIDNRKVHIQTGSQRQPQVSPQIAKTTDMYVVQVYCESKLICFNMVITIPSLLNIDLCLSLGFEKYPSYNGHFRAKCTWSNWCY